MPLMPTIWQSTRAGNTTIWVESSTVLVLQWYRCALTSVSCVLSLVNSFSPLFQVGDALVRVNGQQLTLLNHSSVVDVLRGLLRMQGDQILLLRFEYSQDSERHHRRASSLRATPIPAPTPTPTPTLPSPSSTTNLSDMSRAPQSMVESKHDTFRPESWHGSRPAGGGDSDGGGRGAVGGSGRVGRTFQQPSGETREQAKSVSPPHFKERGGGGGGAGVREEDRRGLGTSRADPRRHSSPYAGARNGSSTMPGLGVGLGDSGEGSNGADHMRRNLGEPMVNQGYGGLGTPLSGRGAGGARREMTTTGELWGERAIGVEVGGSSSRHVYLGDMGHARAQRTLGYIAQDVQVRWVWIILC